MKLSIEYLAPSALKPHPRNARKHPPAQLRLLEKAMGKRFTAPLLIDQANQILAGHARWEVAKKLGLEALPCVRHEGISDAEARQIMLADNAIALKAGWEYEMLADEIMFQRDLGYDLDLTGFTTPEIDQILEIAAESKGEDAIEAPLPPVEPHAVTAPRDLYLLGKHKLYCGNARDRAAYEALLGDERAAFVITDPPYNVPIDGFVGGKGKIKHREFAQGVGEMTPEEFTAWLTDACTLMSDFSSDGSIHMICMDHRGIGSLLDAGARVYAERKNIIVWVKDNAGMGAFYRSQHELICAFKKGTAPHINNFELGQHGRHRSNVWRYAGINSMAADRLELLAMHPTVKPLPMLIDALKDCSRPSDIVLDPFGGSGTTLIAAERTGRAARLIELDPLYCDVIIRRWQNLTGKQAMLAGENVTFDEVEHALDPGPPRAHRETLEDF